MQNVSHVLLKIILDIFSTPSLFSIRFRSCLYEVMRWATQLAELARLISCFIFKFTVCLYEEAGFPACRDLGSSNRDLGKSGQPDKAN